MYNIFLAIIFVIILADLLECENITLWTLLVSFLMSSFRLQIRLEAWLLADNRSNYHLRVSYDYMAYSHAERGSDGFLNSKCFTVKIWQSLICFPIVLIIFPDAILYIVPVVVSWCISLPFIPAWRRRNTVGVASTVVIIISNTICIITLV